VAQGMFFLGEEGLKRVKKGETSLDELLRVIEVEDHLPILCEGCGESLSPYFRVCPFCSLPLASRCKSCGKSLRAEWKVCPYCSDFRV
jgi:hypothetical protein